MQKHASEMKIVTLTDLYCCFITFYCSILFYFIPFHVLSIMMFKQINLLKSKINPLYSELFLGYARERIEGARLESFETGISGSVWNRLLSQCQFISFTKNIFFNNIVLKKGNYVKSAKYFW
jgi:hypothetical protein